MAGERDNAIHHAEKALERAEAAGNEKTVKRATEILKELGSHTTTNQQN
jgi:flagellin-specific chaperone FliS